MDGSPPGSPIPGILQAGVLEWVPSPSPTYVSQYTLLSSQVVLVVKKPTFQCRRLKRYGFDPWVSKIPWRRKQQPTPEFLPRDSQGQRSLVGYNLWGRKGLDMTEAS